MAAPSIELISRAARRWKSSGYSPGPATASSANTSSSTSSANSSLLAARLLSPWDFSEVVTATDQVRVAFENGAAIAKRPPRAGVSGTYFFCASDNDAAIGVFKPMDEEATAIDLCPSPPTPMYSFAPGIGHAGASVGVNGVTSTAGSNPSSIASSLPTLPLDSLFALGPAHCGSSVSPSSIACSPPSQHAWPLGSTNGKADDCDNSHHHLQNYPPLHSPPNGLANNTVLNHTHNTNGFFQGEGAYREVAAYLLDHDRFAGVPQTALLQWAKPAHPSTVQESDFSEEEEDDDEEEYSDYDDDDDDVEDDEDSDELSDEEDDDEYSTDEEDDENDEFEGGTTTNSHCAPLPSPTLSAQRNIQTKKGAFQVYVPNLGDADDFGPGVFDKAQVERIAVLDIRTVNHDRHGGNILVTSSSSKSPSTKSTSKYNLVPIDHGYILPDTIRSVPWPVWMDWPCVREPVSRDVRQYVQYLDADRDVRCLTAEFADTFAFRPGALRSLRIATTLLQKGVAAGLTLYDIGLLLYARRDHPHDRSELEKLVSEAEEASRARAAHLTSDQLFDASSSSSPPSADAASPKPKSKPKPLAAEHHRRHQSSNAICDALLDDIHLAPVVDDFVVKYVARRIQELVNRIAAAKAGPGSGSPGSSSSASSSSPAASSPCLVASPTRKPNAGDAFPSSSSSSPRGRNLFSSVSDNTDNNNNINTMSDMDRDKQLELFFAGQTTTPFGAGIGTGTGTGTDSSSRSFNPLPNSSSSRRASSSPLRPSFLTRARSIPDFGIGGGGSSSTTSTPSSKKANSSSKSASIGAKPVHTLIEPQQGVPLPLPLQLQLPPDPAAPPAPTPASSPGAEHATSNHSASPLQAPFLSHAHGRVARTPPIQIAINDERVNRIALPPSPVGAAHASGSGNKNSSSSSSSSGGSGGGRRSEFIPKAAVDGAGNTAGNASGHGSGLGKGIGIGQKRWFDSPIPTAPTSTMAVAGVGVPVSVPVPVPSSSSAKLPPLAPPRSMVGLVPPNATNPTPSPTPWTQS